MNDGGEKQYQRKEKALRAKRFFLCLDRDRRDCNIYVRNSRTISTKAETFVGLFDAFFKFIETFV